MSAEETFLNLFDTYWFEHRPFAPTKKAAAPFPQDKKGGAPQESVEEPKKLNKITTLMRKSHSDHHLSSKDASSSEPSSPSPKSVLGPHLQTILSGKEVESFDETEEYDKINKAGENEKKVDKAIHRRRKRRGGASKSLTELEVEELKGFMDLGFVFSDEDRDSNSRLVSIIPGLMTREGKGVSETTASRPYLSEAWERMEEEERVVKNPMMDWRIPAFGNEMELKDHLRFWAHSVASTVR